MVPSVMQDGNGIRNGTSAIHRTNMSRTGSHHEMSIRDQAAVQASTEKVSTVHSRMVCPCRNEKKPSTKVQLCLQRASPQQPGEQVLRSSNSGDTSRADNRGRGHRSRSCSRQESSHSEEPDGCSSSPEASSIRQDWLSSISPGSLL